MTAPDVPHQRAAVPGAACFAGVRASGVVESVDVRAEPERLAAGGWWAVVGTFSGEVRAWRFAHVERADDGAAQGRGRGAAWRGPARSSWSSSTDRAGYVAAVEATREAIREGEVFQANVCRVLSAPLAPVPDLDGTPREPSAAALAARLATGNPAPYAGFVHVPRGGPVPGTWVVSASPELFLRLEADRITSAPIKGTAREPAGLTEKDRAENVMITDLVRNDLQRVCAPGTVEVTELLALERHPGLVHLVSTVSGLLDPAVAASPERWAHLLEASFPPGSVSGAPKSSALEVIARLEPVDRGPYCGTVGWVDADSGRAELAVAIRTFWWDDADGGTLRFGTGAGITWGSDPEAEWEETELKASRLVQIASSGPDWAP